MLVEAAFVLFSSLVTTVPTGFGSSPGDAPSLAVAYLNRCCCVVNVPQHFRLGWILLGLISRTVPSALISFTRMTETHPARSLRGNYRRTSWKHNADVQLQQK